MPTTMSLKPATPWVQLTTTAADWDAADPALLSTMLVQLHRVRPFEEEVLELAGRKLIDGPTHSSIGQEGQGGRLGAAAGRRRRTAAGP